ncbi:MAG: hypothetical protein ACMUIU_03705 [bacterium]
MKTEKDLNATNQLIKVIRGEAFSMPQMETSGESESAVAVTVSSTHAGWWTWGKIFTLVLIFTVISFTFLSVSFLSGEIKDLENKKNELLRMQKQMVTPPELSTVWKQKEELAQKLDSVSSFLSTQRPYVSSLLKEISNIFPKNCFLNRLYLFFPSQELSINDTAITIEATLVDYTSYRGADLSNVVKSIEDSPLFTQARIGYQDRAMLFNHRTIDFQIDFSLE